jgi:hypothetical protein
MKSRKIDTGVRKMMGVLGVYYSYSQRCTAVEHLQPLLKQIVIFITLAKTQNSFSNNSSNQLAIYPHLLFTGLARGKNLLSRSRGHCAEGEASRAASAALPDGLGGAPGRPRGWSRGAGLAGARRTAASVVVPRRRGEEVPRPPVRRRR